MNKFSIMEGDEMRIEEYKISDNIGSDLDYMIDVPSIVPLYRS